MEIEKYEKIRKGALERYDDDHFYHVKSMINWMRFIKNATFVSKHIPKNGKVLDIGCGGGEPSALIKTMRPDVKMFGVDIRKRKTWPFIKKLGVNLIQDTGENLKRFKDEEFDVVASFGVLEHVENEKKFLDETFRVLKNGGYYFIFDLPNKTGFSEFIADMIIKTHHHPIKYTTNRIRRMLSKYTKSRVKAKRSYVVPAQFHRLSEKLGEMLNKNYMLLSMLDDFLEKTPLNMFAQSITAYCQKT